MQVRGSLSIKKNISLPNPGGSAPSMGLVALTDDKGNLRWGHVSILPLDLNFTYPDKGSLVLYEDKVYYSLVNKAKGLSIENKFMWKELLGNDPLTKDQLAAINESNAPSLANPFVTMRSLSALKLVGDVTGYAQFEDGILILHTTTIKETGNTSFVKNSFDFTGQQSFILTEDLFNIFLLTVNGQILDESQYSITDKKQLNIIDELDPDDHVIICFNLIVNNPVISFINTPTNSLPWQKNEVSFNSTGLKAGNWSGTIGEALGTFTRGLPESGAVYNTVARSRYTNVSSTLNQVIGIRNTEALFMRGAAPLQGGFLFYCRAGMDMWRNGGRMFVGMHSNVTVVTNDPSLLNNTMGFCIDATDVGKISFLTRGTAATKADTGMKMISGKGFDFYMSCSPNDTKVHWRIVDINEGTEASGVAVINLPSNTVALTVGALASNAALVQTVSIQLGINRIYTETDY